MASTKEQPVPINEAFAHVSPFIAYHVRLEMFDGELIIRFLDGYQTGMTLAFNLSELSETDKQDEKILH